MDGRKPNELVALLVGFEREVNEVGRRRGVR